MSSASGEQIQILLDSALDAETLSQWPKLLKLCEQGLKANGLEPYDEALFRRLHARALVPLATSGKKANAYDINLLREAIDDAGKAIVIFSTLDPPPTSFLIAEAYDISGGALYALSLTPDGRAQRSGLLVQAIEHFEKALQYEERAKTRKLLGRVKEHLDFVQRKQQDEKKTGCFIATAAYGSPLAPEVVLLRRFRDRVLLKSRMGAVFVKLYYVTSPFLAPFISKSAFLRVITRQVLLRPLLRFLKGYIKISMKP